MESPGTVEQPYTYTGREFDAESGLYYYRARYYDATTGRFLQKDPLGLDAGINLYAYVDNNPVNLIDPHGLYILNNPPAPRKPPLPPDYGSRMDIFLKCLDWCYGSPVLVTSTHEIVDTHTEKTPHGKGVAVDIGIPTDKDKMSCCAAQCGAKWGYEHGPKNAHLHYQLVSGRNGGSVDNGRGGIVKDPPPCGCS